VPPPCGIVSPMVKPVRHGPRNDHGLVLDDYLNAVADVRRRFQLTLPTIDLEQMKLMPAARKTIEAIINETIDRHGSEIYSNPHLLLAESGNEIYAEPIKTEVYSGNKIRQDCISQTLQKAIEVGLQTIVQLPSREAKPASVPKRLKSVASSLSRLAGKLNVVLCKAEVRNHINLWEDHETRARLLRVSAEMQWGGEALDAIKRLSVTKVRMNSPNPQISFTMYFIRWIETGTGRQHYEDVATLVQAAFSAARKSPPRWTDRLAIESHFQGKWRKKWIERISS
jgi:hypothetical protein